MSTAYERARLEEERKRKAGTDTMSRIVKGAGKFKNYNTLTGRQPDAKPASNDPSTAPPIQSDLARTSLKPQRSPTVPQQIVAEPPEDTSYRTQEYRNQGRAPALAPEPPVQQTVAAAADPTIESETSGAAPGTTRIPYGSGGNKEGTGKVRMTNVDGNPDGEIIGDVSGFKSRRQPRAISSAESRFRNAVQPGGRGRSARNPGMTVTQPDRQPTVQEEIGPLNTLSDYIREGAKLKARETQADIRKTDSDIRRARDLTAEAQDRTQLDREKLDVDRSTAEGLNEERRARADSLEAETRINRTEADLQEKMLNAETPEERAAYAQQLQQLKAYKPGTERNMNMTQNQIVQERAASQERWRTKVDTEGEDLSYDEYLRKYEPELAAALGETAPEADEVPSLPPKGTVPADGRYRAANGKTVEVKGGKFRYLD